MTANINKAQKDIIRLAFIQKLIGSTSNILVVDNRKTKANAKARADIEALRALGLVKGFRLTAEGEAVGQAEHQRVQAARDAALAAQRRR